MKKTNTFLTTLIAAYSLQSAIAAPFPDYLVSRRLAEDPTLELTENSLVKIKGFPREINIYRCENVCDERPYKHVRLDKAGRVTHYNYFEWAKEYEYGEKHNMPIIVRESMFGDEKFNKKEYIRDDHGNKKYEIYPEGTAEILYSKEGSKIYAQIKSPEGGAGRTEIYQNGLLVEFIGGGMMEHFRPDGTYYMAHVGIREKFTYGYNNDGSLKYIERLSTSESNGTVRINSKEKKYFNLDGFLVAEVSDAGGRVRGVEYIDHKTDPLGNLVHYKQCNVDGAWGKHTKCVSYNIEIVYY